MSAFAAAWVFTFPYEAWQQRLLGEMGREAGLLVTAEGWTAKGPTTIGWNGVSFSSGDMHLRADRAAFELPLPALARGLAVAGGATWTGLAELGAWSLDGSVRLDGTGREAGQGQPAFSIHGLAHAAFEPVPADPNAEGKLRDGMTARIDLANVTVEGLRIGQAVAPSLSLERLTVAVSCGGTTCRLESVTGTGPDGQVSGQGTVALQRPLPSSELTAILTLTLTEQAVRRGGESLRAVAPPQAARRLNVAGPLAHPRTTVEPGS
jgi:type II secretion system protein N